MGAIDLVHTLSYKGMGAFPNLGSNLPTQLWIIARYLESTGLFVSTFFPICYTEGSGLTVFKIASEYAIVSFLAFSLVRMYQERFLLERYVFLLVCFAIVLTASSELSFTLYNDVYGAFNMLGHLLKLISFYLIYLSVVRTGITVPHALLFRATKESENRLRKAVEEKKHELLRLQERVLEIERGAAFGEVAASVIHDIKTPMQALLNLAFMLRESDAVKKDEKLKAILDRIEKQISYLKMVILELNSFTKPMSPSIAPVDLNTVLSGAITSIEIPSSIKTEIKLQGGLPKILVDPVFMQRVLINLIVNAVEAMPNGGILKISAYKEGNKVLVNVSDTGVGIDPDDREKIFRPMFTTKKSGAGLGLAISKRLLESIGGSIEFTSEPGKGTVFSLRLPTSE